jgi:hypothetical protein
MPPYYHFGETIAICLGLQDFLPNVNHGIWRKSENAELAE